jgi:hypothetical protein
VPSAAVVVVGMVRAVLFIKGKKKKGVQKAGRTELK